MVASHRFSVFLVVAACSFPRPADVKNESVSIGGEVHGLWTGADGVALRLMASGVETLHTVTSNGSFSFPRKLAEDDSYIIAIASHPTRHTCEIIAGANGVVPASDATDVEVACRGPAVTITPSAPQPWTFDPTRDVQDSLDVSVLLQEVTFSVDNPDGFVTSARVAGLPVVPGRPSAPQLLPLGELAIDVALEAQGNLSKTYQIVIRRGQRLISQAVYGKASNAGGGFGVNIAVSGDTLAVGAPAESSSATGINGDQTNTGARLSGAVYVFQRTGSTWVQQAYIKASNTQAGDTFGASVALSGDSLAVGAPREDSSATGINQNQADNTVVDSGAVYVFQRIGTTWSQQAYIKPSDTETREEFGEAIALSGGTLAVGAIGETSSATGINGDQTNRGASNSGAVYVFQRTGANWVQEAYIKASNAAQDDQFGYAVALSGSTLAVNAISEGSSATGINGDQSNNDAPLSGAVYVFERSQGSWSQQAYIKAMNTGAGGGFSFGAALAIDGDTLVAGASGDSIDVPTSGAVYVFHRTGSTWSQQAFVKASNPDVLDLFGARVALSGEILAVGATQEASNATGIGGDQMNNDLLHAGAVYVFHRAGTTWTQQAYIKASNPGRGDSFGTVALSGNTLVVAAPREASGAIGINGNQQDDSVPDAGAIYLFR
jgi:trimeric autotransporter adhesin